MSRYEQKVGNKYIPIVIALISIILIATAFWFFQSGQTDNSIKSKTIKIPQQQNMLDDKQGQSSEKLKKPTPSPSSDLDSEQKKHKESLVDRVKIKDKLPELKNSDDSFQAGVEGVSGNLLEWFKKKGVIKRFIIIINDFSQGQMLYKNRTFLSPPGKIKVKNSAKGLYLSTRSYSRYDPFANAVADIDLQKGLDLYLIFRPLFEKVYKSFSYPAAYKVEDIFLKAATRVIEAPTITDRIYLVKHTISYKYADKKLESLNDVEKLMIRMGPENTKKIQAKLRQLAEAIAVLDE